MIKIILKNFLIPLLVGAGFFVFNNICLAIDHIIISEIQITGGEGKTNNEFIELYNPTNQEINLTGFSLKKKKSGAESNLVSSGNFTGVIQAYGFFLIAHQDYKTAINADLAYSGSSYYISSDSTVNLYDANGNLLDKVGYGAAQDFEKQATIEPNKNECKSISRKIINNIIQDTENNNVDFEIKDTPTPQNSNSLKLMPVNGQQDNQGNQANQNNTATSTAETASSTQTVIDRQIYKLGDVLINEFVSDPGDNEVEWIEIYNKIDREIDLTGWWIEEGSKTKTKLEGIINAGNFNRYKIVEKPVGNLNNNGDIIILYDSSGKIIDQISYGNWNDGNLEDNAPIARDPDSVARKFDGYNTYNNFNDFSVTIKPTKGVSNIIQLEDEVSAEAKSKFDFSNDIFISEIFPNPAGNDIKLEFIEVYNIGQRDVNLTGWSLSNKYNKKINFEKFATSTIIKAKGYLAFFRTQTKIVMHNDQGEVKLFQPLADKPIQTVIYKNVKENESYNLVLPCARGQEEYNWSETTTFGAANIIKTVNHAPEVEFSLSKEILVCKPIIFDSSDTIDQDNDELKFSWEFGDGFKSNLANPEHTYLKTGIYKVKLEVSDGKDKAEKVKNIKIVNNADEFNNGKINASAYSSYLSEDISDNNNNNNNIIIINEIFPNPKGADKNSEWLELKNQSLDKINLINWRIENSNGKYKFKDNLWVTPENFYLLTNKESKLAFKNTSDIVSLYNSSDELIDQVEYAEAVQDESYGRGENSKWFWTTMITPEAENIINVAKSFATSKNQAAGIKSSKENIIATTLEEINQREIGDLIRVKGKVAVLPGILGAQYFYIVGSPGLQIYNYKKEFPGLLKVGDYIEVVGELSEINNEARLKTTALADIKILDHQNPPIAKSLSSDQFGEEYLGQLISITGEITDKKGSTVYLDDGNNETEIYLKRATGIKSSSIKEGKIYTITGIVAKTQSGLKLMPRFKDDIAVQTQAEEAIKVLGNTADSDEWMIAGRNKKIELFKYLLIVAIGVITLLIGLIIKTRKNK